MLSEDKNELLHFSGTGVLAGDRTHVTLAPEVAVSIDSRRYQVELAGRHARRLVVSRAGPGAFVVRGGREGTTHADRLPLSRHWAAQIVSLRKL